MALHVDEYALRARLLPAALAIAPAMMLCFLFVATSDLRIVKLLSALMMAVLLYAFTALADALGRLREPKILAHVEADLAAAIREFPRGSERLSEAGREGHGSEALFQDRVAYCFRRNLLGSKSAGLAINALVTLLAVYALLSADGESSNDTAALYPFVLLVAGLHAAYFVTFVTVDEAAAAANTYARRLIKRAPA